MSELFARGGEWKQTFPDWTEEELRGMQENGGELPAHLRREKDGGPPDPTPPTPPPQTVTSDMEDLTPEQRLAYLRERGVVIETHEDRANKAKQAVAAVPLRKGHEFCYLKIPHDSREPVARLHSNVADGDALLHVLKPVFADTAVLDKKTVERETAERLSQMMAQQPLQAPSLETMQKLGNEGGAEAYPLARGDAENGYRAVSLYIDEIGTLRARTRNARAEKLCAAAGLTGLSIHGDAYVGRLQIGPQGQRNVDFYDSELEEDAEWLQMARRTHMAEAAAIHDKGPAKGSGANYEWSQTDDEVEVVVSVEVDKDEKRALKTRVKVDYGAGETLKVLVDGAPIVLVHPLFAPVDTTGCSWTVDGKDKLVVTMEKRDERMWHTLHLHQG